MPQLRRCKSSVRKREGGRQWRVRFFAHAWLTYVRMLARSGGVSLLRVLARWLAEVPAERRAEGARRTVAHAFRDLLDSQVLPPQQSLGQRHAPREEIFHGRHPDSPG